MPIYEYMCSDCSSSFELLRPLSQADQEADCPKCHKPAQRKLSTFTCFSTTGGGVPKAIAGTSGSSCSSCSSGSCSTCGS